MKSRWIFYSLFIVNHILHSQTFSVQVETEDIGTLKKDRPSSRSLFLVAMVQKIGLQRLIIISGPLNFRFS